MKSKVMLIILILLSIISILSIGASFYLYTRLDDLDKKYNNLIDSSKNEDNNTMIYELKNELETVELKYAQLNDKIEEVSKKEEENVKKIDKKIDDISKITNNNSSSIKTINSKISTYDSNVYKTNTMYNIHEKLVKLYKTSPNSNTALACTRYYYAGIRYGMVCPE